MTITRLSGSSINFKSNIKEPWSRKKSTITTFGFAGAVTDMFVANKVTNKIISKTNTNMSYMVLNSLVGLGILGTSILAGYLFYLYDKKHPTKFVDLMQKIDNYDVSNQKKKPEEIPSGK